MPRAHPSLARAAAGLAALLATTFACSSGNSGHSGYFTYYLIEPDTYFYVPWAKEPPQDLGQNCFLYEFNHIQKAASYIGTTRTQDNAKQQDQTYIHYTGEMSGDPSATCIGILDAQFTFMGTRYQINGTVTRGFRDPRSLMINDDNPYASGSYTIAPNQGPDGGFFFWPYEYSPSSPVSKVYLLEPI
jgi:hypothetical protein